MARNAKSVFFISLKLVISSVKQYVAGYKYKNFLDLPGSCKTFEYQKNSYTGSAQKGYETFIESRAVSYDDMLASIQNNQELMDMAKESAKTQVTNLSL